MKLYAVKYTDEESKPQTEWCATATDVAAFLRELGKPATVEHRTLPASARAMAEFFNHNNVEGWQ